MLISHPSKQAYLINHIDVIGEAIHDAPNGRLVEELQPAPDQRVNQIVVQQAHRPNGNQLGGHVGGEGDQNAQQRENRVRVDVVVHRLGFLQLNRQKRAIVTVKLVAGLLITVRPLGQPKVTHHLHSLIEYDEAKDEAGQPVGVRPNVGQIDGQLNLIVLRIDVHIVERGRLQLIFIKIVHLVHQLLALLRGVVLHR